MSTRRELVLAANLMAAPHLVPKCPIDPERMQEPAAKAVLTILRKGGKVFARPDAMLTALEDYPGDVDREDLVELFDMIPEPDEIDYAGVAELTVQIQQDLAEIGFLKRAQKVLQNLVNKKVSIVEVIGQIQEAIEAYRSGISVRQVTATAVLERLKSGKVNNIRWALGAESLDAGYWGIDRNGEAIEGALAQGELVVIAAGYKVGKTRMMFDVVAKAVDQGGSVALFVLEDSEETFATKLMAARWGVEFHKVGRYLAGKYTSMDPDEMGRLESAVEWYAALGQRLRIYDVSSFPEIFNWNAMREMITVDKALFDTTHCFIDYAQALESTEEYKDMARIAREMRKACAGQQIVLVVLSQRSNESIKGGVTKGYLDAKGAGDWGQHCHIGYVLSKDEASEANSEIKIEQVVARNGYNRTVYAVYDTKTGQTLAYNDEPVSMPNFGPAPKEKKAGKK